MGIILCYYSTCMAFVIKGNLFFFVTSYIDAKKIFSLSTIDSTESQTILK